MVMVWWPMGADLTQSPLSNVRMEGFAGVVVEEAHAEGCEPFVRALVHISPMIQEEVDNVTMTMHLESDKVGLTSTGTIPQQDMRKTTWHLHCPSQGCNVTGHTTCLCLVLVKGQSSM